MQFRKFVSWTIFKMSSDVETPSLKEAPWALKKAVFWDFT